MKISHLYVWFLRSSVVKRVTIVVLCIILFFGLLFRFLEPQAFSSIFIGIWFSLVTAFTVGYGDTVPTTTIGKVLAMLLIVMGTAFVSYFTASIASQTFQVQNSYVEGKRTFRGRNHIIIVGWNARVRQIIDYYSLSKNQNPILIIDESLIEIPTDYHFLHFVKGNPTIDETYRRANISEANKILITADQQRDEVSADSLTVLATLAIKSLNPNIPCIIELLTVNQIENAKRAGADEIIETNKYSGHLMINSLLYNGISNMLGFILNRQNAQNFDFLLVSSEEVGQSFRSVLDTKLNEHILVVGIYRKGTYFINLQMHTILEDEDSLIVIK